MQIHPDNLRLHHHRKFHHHQHLSRNSPRNHNPLTDKHKNHHHLLLKRHSCRPWHPDIHPIRVHHKRLLDLDQSGNFHCNRMDNSQRHMLKHPGHLLAGHSYKQMTVRNQSKNTNRRLAMPLHHNYLHQNPYNRGTSHNHMRRQSLPMDRNRRHFHSNNLHTYRNHSFHRMM